MYEIGSYVVCPGHGVGQICDVEQKDMGSTTLAFYIIKIVANGMTIMVPTNSKEGVRELANIEEVEDVFCLLKDHEVKVDNSTWNRRHRDYLSKVKTGSLLEIADVLRSLFLLANSKKLSFGEKKMVDQCKELLVKEIALAQGIQEVDIDKQIDSCFVQQ